jgi:hypothetical protein
MLSFVNVINWKKINTCFDFANLLAGHSLILEYSKNHTTLEKTCVGLVHPFYDMRYHLGKGIYASKFSHKGKDNI